MQRAETVLSKAMMRVIELEATLAVMTNTNQEKLQEAIQATSDGG